LPDRISAEGMSNSVSLTFLYADFLLPSQGKGVAPDIDRNAKILRKPRIISGSNLKIVA